MAAKTPTLEGWFGYRIKRLVSALRASMDAALGSIGISPPQYMTLAALSARPGASNATLARLCFVTPQTMVKLVRALELARLVERVEADVDRRKIALQVTAEGRRRMAAGYKRIRELETAALAPIAEGQRQALLNHLDVLATALEGGRVKTPTRRTPVASGHKRRAR